MMIERALTKGAILRTHVLRPTWHLVAAADIRWMLALTGPRVSARMFSHNRHLELDAGVFRRSQSAIVRALRGGVQLTRQELKAVLQRAGIRADSAASRAHRHAGGNRRGGVQRGAPWHAVNPALLDERVHQQPRNHETMRSRIDAPVFHEPRTGTDRRLRLVVRADDRRRSRITADRSGIDQRSSMKTYWFRQAASARRPQDGGPLRALRRYRSPHKDRSAALDRSR